MLYEFKEQWKITKLEVLMYYQQGMQKIEVIVRKEDSRLDAKENNTQEPIDV